MTSDVVNDNMNFFVLKLLLVCYFFFHIVKRVVDLNMHEIFNCH